MADDKKTNNVGTFWGVPYDWHRPTWARYRSRLWNPDEPRLIMPRAFGWGYDLNFYRLFHHFKGPSS
jgi:hypothetical protein